MSLMPPTSTRPPLPLSISQATEAVAAKTPAPLSASSSLTVSTPPLESKTLSNGSKAYLQTLSGAARSTVLLQLPMDPLNQEAHTWLPYLLLRANEAQRLENRELSRQGFGIQINTGSLEGAQLEVSGPKGQEGALLNYVKQVLTQAQAIDPQLLSLERFQKSQLITQAYNSPGSRSLEENRKGIFGPEHPANRLLSAPVQRQLLEQGDPRQAQLELQELLKRPQQWKLLMVSPLAASEQAGLLEQTFGTLKPQAPNREEAQLRLPVVPDKQGALAPVLVEEPSRSRTHLSLNWQGPPPDHPDSIPFLMLTKYLNGMSGELFKELRTEKGLVYSTHQTYNPSRIKTAYNVTADVDFSKTPEALQATEQVFQHILSTPLSPESLDRVKRRTILTLMDTAQNSESLAGLYGQRLERGKAPKPVEQLAKEVMAVTPQQVMDVAHRYLNPAEGGFFYWGIEAPKPVLQQLFPNAAVLLPPAHLPLPAGQPSPSSVSSGLSATTLGNPTASVCAAPPAEANTSSTSAASWLSCSAMLSAPANLAPTMIPPLQYGLNNRFLQG
jgi:predicted Zn-dependent peptidase